MHSTINPIYPDSQIRSPALSPEDAELVARADERLMHAYGQIARADEQLAQVNKQLSKLELEGTRHPSGPKNPSRGRPAVRGLVGLLLAAGICLAALAAQSSYGDAARNIVQSWTARAVSPSSVLQQRAESSPEPALPSGQATATYAVLEQPAPSAQTASQDAAPSATSRAPELAPMLQAMSSDLASLQQATEQLKASQDQIIRNLGEFSEQLAAVHGQMTRDRADAAEQLKAVQERVAGITANASDQNLRPKTPVPSPRPIAANTTRKQVPTRPPAQARQQQGAPLQLRTEQLGRP